MDSYNIYSLRKITNPSEKSNNNHYGNTKTFINFGKCDILIVNKYTEIQNSLNLKSNIRTNVEICNYETASAKRVCTINLTSP